MLGDIDYNLNPVKPQYFLCKPNRVPISKLSEVYDDSINIVLNDVDELTFSIPQFIDVHHRLVKNKNIDLIKERYLIKVVRGNSTDWFTVIELTDDIDDDKEIKTVRCYSITHELTDKRISGYSVESYQAEQVLKDILANSIWNIDYLDADFKLTYRAFEFNSTNALDAIFSIAETYNAIVTFNTDKRTVSMSKPELTGIDRGFTVDYGKLLKAIEKKTSSEEMVTRLVAIGNDGLGIQKVNPTGQSYIEDFSYFMYPFERDANKNIISSSLYMSNSLCGALVDYSELVKSKTGVFESLLDEVKRYEVDLGKLQVDLNLLEQNGKVITETVLAQQFDDKMFFEKYTHTTSSSRSFKINKNFAYAVLIKIGTTSGVSVKVDNSTVSPISNKWTLIGKKYGVESTTVTVTGSSTDVFIQVANISLDEYKGRNDEDIVNRYSLDNKEMQISVKKMEIDAKQDQIDATNKKIKELQTTLAAENNFTSEQLQELNLYVVEREFSDDKYIDEKDLYKAAWEKFRELQQPQLNVDIDIVNFYEIIEEQRNWDKLRLGDFINVKYKPTGISLTARVTGIEYDFEGNNITLTLSNAKNVNDESKRIEKFLNDSKKTNVTVDINKNKWGKAVIDTSEMSELFENFWNKVTNEINMASNEFVTIDRKGITIIDPNDPLRFLRATHGVLGLTRSGGLRYETAISPDGVIAEMVLGKIILGQRVVIGDTTGVFTIEGSTLTIQDRYSRVVAKLGLLSERPDAFGFYLNRYATASSIDTTVINQVRMTADEGFLINRIRNGVTSKIFGTSLDGDLYLRAGEDNEVLTIDSYGLGIGSESWASAPFRVNYKGECWLEALWATDAYLVNAYIENAEIQNSLFDNGHIRGSDLELRDGSGGMIKMYPQYGLWFGAENFSDAIASIAMDGTAKFKKLKVTDGNNLLLMDSDQRKIWMNNWDIIGAGAIDAQLIAANIVTAIDGFVSDLTASRLTTLTNAALGNWSNYIRIEGNTQKFITGMVDGTGTQKTLPDGRLLYWKTSAQSGEMTTDVTPWPVLVYDMREKEKMIFAFKGSGDEATPYIKMGIGDGSGSNGGLAFIDKYNGGLKISYGQSNTGSDRSIDIADLGITIKADDNGDIVIKGRNIKIEASGKVNVSGTEYVFE